MIPYSGGDDIGAIVCEVGSHTTKMGFAGEDAPRALFRSDVAVLRSEIESGTEESSSDLDRRVPSGPIEDIRYEWSRPLNPSTGTDGDYQPANPIDPATGLLRLTDTISSDTSPTPSSPRPLFLNLMSHGYQTSLCSANPSEHPLLFVERSYDPPAHRQSLTELLFEQFHLPALFLARDAVLSCYACGRTTGVVVDIGSIGTTVTPVYDGFVEHRGVMRSPVGGAFMDRFTLEILESLYRQQRRQQQQQQTTTSDREPLLPWYQATSKLPSKPKRNEPFHKLCRYDLARSAKESIVEVASIGYDPNNLNSRYATMPATPLHLPDGTVLDIGQERFNVSESLFGKDDISSKKRDDAASKARKAYTSGAVVGSGGTSVVASAVASPPGIDAGIGPGSTVAVDSLGEISSCAIQNMICEAAFKCDRDQQAQLLGNVLLSGGGACLEGMTDRLKDEVEAIIHTHTPGWRVKVLAPALPERTVCSWLGGSILSSLGSFHDMWVTKAEYEESGSAIVNRKCP